MICPVCGNEADSFNDRFRTDKTYITCRNCNKVYEKSNYSKELNKDGPS